MALRATLGTRRNLIAFASSIGIGAAVCVPLGFLAAVASMFGATTVLSQRGLAHVSLGYPFRWLSQDQTFFSPARFPTQATFENPHHSPTHLALAGPFADAAVWAVALWLALLVLLAVALLIRRGIRRTRRNPAGPAVSTLG
jgi:hypothetical protein